jgi:hypothetical protein
VCASQSRIGGLSGWSPRRRRQRLIEPVIEEACQGGSGVPNRLIRSESAASLLQLRDHVTTQLAIYDMPLTLSLDVTAKIERTYPTTIASAVDAHPARPCRAGGRKPRRRASRIQRCTVPGGTLVPVAALASSASTFATFGVVWTTSRYARATC